MQIHAFCSFYTSSKKKKKGKPFGCTYTSAPWKEIKANVSLPVFFFFLDWQLVLSFFFFLALFRVFFFPPFLRVDSNAWSSIVHACSIAMALFFLWPCVCLMPSASLDKSVIAVEIASSTVFLNFYNSHAFLFLFFHFYTASFPACFRFNFRFCGLFFFLLFSLVFSLHSPQFFFSSVLYPR